MRNVNDCYSDSFHLHNRGFYFDYNTYIMTNQQKKLFKYLLCQEVWSLQELIIMIDTCSFHHLQRNSKKVKFTQQRRPEPFFIKSSLFTWGQTISFCWTEQSIWKAVMPPTIFLKFSSSSFNQKLRGRVETEIEIK